MTSMMHPNQIPTNPDLVRCLLRSQYPELANAPISDSPFHGTDSDTYRVGEHHCVRLPIIDWAVGKQEGIAPWLLWLDRRLTLTVPAPVFFGEPGCGYPHTWTIYPWIGGETLPFGSKDPRVAHDIADFLIKLRCLPTEGAPASGRSPHALDADVRKCLAQLTEGDHRDDLIEIWNEMMTMPPWDGTGAVWMHGDVAPGNLLFRGGWLVAAIDWSELGVGDPASDLQVAWNMLGPDARRVLRESMQVDDVTWERARARALAQASFQLPYYRDSLPALAAQAQWVFGEILAEYGKW